MFVLATSHAEGIEGAAWLKATTASYFGILFKMRANWIKEFKFGLLTHGQRTWLVLNHAALCLMFSTIVLA